MEYIFILNLGGEKGSQMIQKLIQALNSVLLGKEDSVELLVAAILANGHVLIEDVPGTGKTTLARALSKAVSADYARIQFTPDLLPADVTGGAIFRPGTAEFEIKKGPVFTQVLLADEINRASPRTQSALLEAMEERSVSLEGKTYALSNFFVVLATENPVEFRGVYPLPEAQMDRFMVRLSLGYPSEETELGIIRGHRFEVPVEKLKPVMTPADVLRIREEVKKIHVDESLELYAVKLVQATRHRSDLRLGASPRAGMALVAISQAFAYMDNRNYVTPDDLQRSILPVLAHRIFAKDSAFDATKKILEDIRKNVSVPR
ncbi:MoxR-like ATPase [Hallerella succinigenes]|uniref:MoxR-like ATPase n=2 Tax=Hallerella succinigenes TaxID=1896222 RepID=A0A2M9A9W4_9BACT|nr:MoxR-like ATPase [Hallerella succinigenes]